MTTIIGPSGESGESRESDRDERFVDFTCSSIAYREGASSFLTTVRQAVGLPEPAYDLWRAGRLGEVLGIPDGRHLCIEVIGGEIVLS